MRDVVIGIADGLTVPFALAAGLAAAVSSAKLIATAGLVADAAGRWACRRAADALAHAFG